MSRMHSGRLAYWAINNLLYVLQMLLKWMVFYHCFLTLGPLGWQAKTQICLQPACSGKKGKKKWPLWAESHSSEQSQFFRCSPFPVPCSPTQTSSGQDEKLCDVIFYSALDTLMEGNVVHWFKTPERSKTRNKIFGSSPGKTFKPRKTKLLIVTPSAAIKLQRSPGRMFHEHVLPHWNSTEPPGERCIECPAEHGD